MNAPKSPSYTSDHKVAEDGSVAFNCATDSCAWRWLELPPSHPIFIQTFNYYISVECSTARGTLDPSKWSALTWMDWEPGTAASNMPVRGVMRNQTVDEKLGFSIELFDADDELVYRAGGRGVVFRNRDFEGWRKQSKDQLASSKVPPAFDYVSRDAVGALEGEHALIGPITNGAAPYANALITQANGMPPGSRYLAGSGDHVNAVHLAEAARQFCALLTGNPDLELSGGEIAFTRYVEFNVPFRIELIEATGSMLVMRILQAAKPCTEIIYRID